MSDIYSKTRKKGDFLFKFLILVYFNMASSGA